MGPIKRVQPGRQLDELEANHRNIAPLWGAPDSVFAWGFSLKPPHPFVLASTVAICNHRSHASDTVALPLLHNCL